MPERERQRGDGEPAGTHLRRFLAAQDHPCPGCGYNLRGLAGSSCPECNEPLDLVIRLAEPRLGPILAALTGLSVGAGSAAVMLFLLITLSLYFGDAPPGGFFVLPLVVMAIGVPILIALTSRAGRRWFRGRSRAARRGVVIACWLLPFAFAIAVLGYIIWTAP